MGKDEKLEVLDFKDCGVKSLFFDWNGVKISFHKHQCYLNNPSFTNPPCTNIVVIYTMPAVICLTIICWEDFLLGSTKQIYDCMFIITCFIVFILS